MIRIMVVHPATLVADLFVETMRQERDLRVIYRTPSVGEALAHIGNDNCDVVVASMALKDNGALTLTNTLKEEHPNVKVVIVGLPEQENLVLDFVAAGAAGYTTEDESIDELLDCVRLAVQRQAIVSPQIAAALMRRLVELRQLSLPDSDSLGALTRRQHQVLSMIAKGMTNADIADQLVLEVGTVKNHVHRILKKLNLHSRKDAATVYEVMK